jgi:hypothetical protein
MKGLRRRPEEGDEGVEEGGQEAGGEAPSTNVEAIWQQILSNRNILHRALDRIDIGLAFIILKARGGTKQM